MAGVYYRFLVSQFVTPCLVTLLEAFITYLQVCCYVSCVLKFWTLSDPVLVQEIAVEIYKKSYRYSGGHKVVVVMLEATLPTPWRLAEQGAVIT